MTTEGFGKRSLLYGAELIFEENYLGGAGRDGHTARGHRPDRMVLDNNLEGPPWCGTARSSFKRLRACDELRRRGPRWKVQAYKHHVAEARNADRLGSDSRPGRPQARNAAGDGPGDGVCASKNDTGQAGCRAPRGAGPGDTVTSAANPQISNYNPPTPSALPNFGPPRANPARFHADSN